MKKQVAEISNGLQGMTKEMWLMREAINQQHGGNVKLNHSIEDLNLQICKKDKENEKLWERLFKSENPDQEF